MSSERTKLWFSFLHQSRVNYEVAILDKDGHFVIGPPTELKRDAAIALARQLPESEQLEMARATLESLREGDGAVLQLALDIIEHVQGGTARGESLAEAMRRTKELVENADNYASDYKMVLEHLDIDPDLIVDHALQKLDERDQEQQQTAESLQIHLEAMTRIGCAYDGVAYPPEKHPGHHPLQLADNVAKTLEAARIAVADAGLDPEHYSAAHCIKHLSKRSTELEDTLTEPSAIRSLLVNSKLVDHPGEPTLQVVRRVVEQHGRAVKQSDTAALLVEAMRDVWSAAGTWAQVKTSRGIDKVSGVDELLAREMIKLQEQRYVAWRRYDGHDGWLCRVGVLFPATTVTVKGSNNVRLLEREGDRYWAEILDGSITRRVQLPFDTVVELHGLERPRQSVMPRAIQAPDDNELSFPLGHREALAVTNFALAVHHGSTEHRHWLTQAAAAFIKRGVVPPAKGGDRHERQRDSRDSQSASQETAPPRRVRGGALSGDSDPQLKRSLSIDMRVLERWLTGNLSPTAEAVTFRDVLAYIDMAFGALCRGELLPPHDENAPHLIGGEFQSDKYPSCPAGKVPLSTKDETAQDLLWVYAQRRKSVDGAFAIDLERALRHSGYRPKPLLKAPEPWRVGSKNPQNVYEGERSVCQAHCPEDARRMVDAVNACSRGEP